MLLTHLPAFFFSSVFSEIFQVSERFYICVWVETCRVNCLVWFGKNWHKICEIVFIIRDGEFAFDVNERTADKIVAFMKEWVHIVCLIFVYKATWYWQSFFLFYPVQKNHPHPLPQRKIGVKWRVRWNTWQMTLSKDSWRKRNMSWSCFMHHVSWISERVTTISFHGTLIQRVLCWDVRRVVTKERNPSKTGN